VLCKEVESVLLQGFVTFTPRLLLVDLKGNIGHLRQEGDLYNHNKDVTLSDIQWPAEKVDLICTPKEEKNVFVNDLEKEENAMVSTEALGKYDLKSRY
jgi:hypothetical protein